RALDASALWAGDVDRAVRRDLDVGLAVDVDRVYDTGDTELDRARAHGRAGGRRQRHGESGGSDGRDRGQNESAVRGALQGVLLGPALRTFATQPDSPAPRRGS